MENKIREEIERFMDGLLADDYEKGFDWNGYEVFEPIYYRPTFAGLPLVVLVKDKEVRLSTGKESLEYLDYSEILKSKNASIEDLETELKTKM